jgi:hypothetical protein
VPYCRVGPYPAGVTVIMKPGPRLQNRWGWPLSSCSVIGGTSRRRSSTPSTFLELNGADLRREPIEVRKATLANILRKSRSGVRLNEHMEHDCGLTVFQHACKMGLEGIVSKRLGSRYRSGRSPEWLKFKNPEAFAVNALLLQTTG